VSGSKGQIVGIAWFERADYPRLLTLFEDREAQWSNYDDWLNSAKRVEAKVKASGQHVVRVKLDPDEFSDWCRQNGLRVDGRARSRFATEGAKRAFDR